MSTYLSLVYRKCIISENNIIFVNDKTTRIEIKDSDVFIKEKYGGDIFDNIDEMLEENITDENKSIEYNNSAYFSLDKIINLNASPKYLYDTNNLRDLKKLIQTELNIPLEFQYIESIDNYGEFSSLCHYYNHIDATLSNIKIRPKIKDISKEDLESDSPLNYISIDKELYYSRNSFEIKENISKLKTLFSYSQDYTLNIYDFMDIINCSIDNNTAVLLNKLKDVDNLNIVYGGFVEKFFPIIQKNYLLTSIKDGGLSSVYPFLRQNKLKDKINVIKYLSSKFKSIKKIEKSVEIQKIKISYSKSQQTNIHILKLYNSLDLSQDVVKIRAYINHKNVLLEKVAKKNLDRQIKLTDIAKKEIKSVGISYLILYIKKEGYAKPDEYTIFSNGNITFLVNNYTKLDSVSAIRKQFINISLKKLYDYLLLSLSVDIQLYFDIASIRQFCVVDSISCSQLINIQPDIKTQSYLQYIFKDLEILDEYKVSNSESLKEIIALFASKRNKSTFKNTLNEFHDYLENISSANSDFYSKQNIQIHIRLNDISITYNNISIDDRNSKSETAGDYVSYFTICNAGLDIYKKLKEIEDKKKAKDNNDFYSTSKRIKLLKQSDPLLFNTDSKDKENKYSRLCQSKQQPLIISRTLANSNKYKSKSVKYWNFTKGAPEYYTCDSKDYPYLKFITGNHPNNFCLPCCKKKMVDKDEDSTSSYKDKHSSCLEKHIYIKKSKEEQSVNRYISLYSCKIDLEENRLMKLSPTLNKLIKSSSSLFIVGVKPFSGLIESYILKTMSMYKFGNYLSSIEILLEIIDIFQNNSELLYQLKDGELLTVFSNNNDIIDFLYACAEGDIVHNFTDDNGLDWDSIFIEIINIFYDVKIIEIAEEDNNTINDSNIFIDSEVLDLRKNNRYIVIFRRVITSGETVRYPLAKIDLTNFYTDYSIDSISFDNNSKTIQSINSIISVDYQIEQSGRNIETYKLDLDWVINALNKKYFTINTIFLNSFKNIYALDLKLSKHGNVLIWSDYISYLSLKENLNAKFEYRENIEMSRDYNLECVLYFCKMFKLNITKIFINQKDYVVGGIINNKYLFRINKEVKKLEKTIKDIEFSYFTETKSIDNSFKNNIKESLYEVNMYSILMLHINNKLSKKINYSTRDKIINIFSELITKKYGDTTSLELSECFFRLQKIISLDDSHRIIYSFSNTFKDNCEKKSSKSVLDIVLDSLSFLSSYRYEFDRNVENVNKETIKEFLQDIVIIDNVNDDLEFDMNLGVCSNKNSYYCKDGKYIIRPEEYEEIVEVVVRDLTNDYKKKYILQYNDIHTKSSTVDSELYIKQYKNSNTLIYGL